MPDLIKLSDLKNDHPLTLNGSSDLLLIASYTQQGETGYTSLSVTPNQIGAHAVESMTFANLQTASKTVEGAINEIKGAISGSTWTDVTGTLTAGSTSITLQSAVITTNSTVEIYTADGTPWNTISVATGSVTVTFDAQQSDLGVKARIS